MNEFSSNNEQNVKESNTIELGINDALIVCNIKDVFEEFSKDLFNIVSDKNGHYNLKKVSIIDDLSCGKIVFGQKKLKEFYEKNKSVFKSISEEGGFYYFFAINSDVNGNLYGNTEITKFYNYIKNIEDISKIKDLLNRLNQLGFKKLDFNKEYDFTNKEYRIDKIYEYLDLIYVDNIEIIPTYNNNDIYYRTSNSNYLFKKSSYSYNNTIYLNDLTFDPNRLPEDISRKILKKYIIDLNDEVKEKSSLVKNSVDLVVGVEDLTAQYISFSNIVSKIEDIKDKKELENALRNIYDNLQIIKHISDGYNNNVSETTNLNQDALDREKDRYIYRRFMSRIDID